MIDELPAIREELIRIRRRRRNAGLAAIGVFALWMPFGMLTEVLFPDKAGDWAYIARQLSGLLILVSLVVVALVIWTRGIASTCPRCGKAVFRRRDFRNPFALRCLNCKAPLYPPSKGACDCLFCGHDLTGNESGACPECGTAIKP